MMTERQLIERLLELQEHPELMTDEQLRQALDDPRMSELVAQMAFAKRTFKNEELQGQECDTEEEWSRFASKHFDEQIDTKQDNRSIGHGPHSNAAHRDAYQSKIFQLPIFSRQKVASFIGLLVVSGIAYAAIHIVRLNSNGGGNLKSPTQETQIPNPHQQMVSTDTVKTDSAVKTTQNVVLEPIVFDNVRLDEMLPQIAAYYHTEVVFQNEATRELRFHFVWKHEDGIEHAIEKLNRFESLMVRLEENKIVVE